MQNFKNFGVLWYLQGKPKNQSIHFLQLLNINMFKTLTIGKVFNVLNV